MLLSLLIGSKLIRSIRPLTQGMQALAEDKKVYIEPKGILASLAQSLNRASALLQQRNESLKSRDEARSNWITGISHDIRTPLSMILGYASDLEENDSVPAEQRRQAAIIRQQIALFFQKKTAKAKWAWARIANGCKNCKSPPRVFDIIKRCWKGFKGRNCTALYKERLKSHIKNGVFLKYRKTP